MTRDGHGDRDGHGQGDGGAGGHAPGAPARGPDDLVHITTPQAWAAARRAGVIAPPSLAAEGFVHCSTRGQLGLTLARHFRGAGPLLVLVLDPRAVAADLRWVESHPGERFPHVHAPVPVGAVVAVEEVTPPTA